MKTLHSHTLSLWPFRRLVESLGIQIDRGRAQQSDVPYRTQNRMSEQEVSFWCSNSVFLLHAAKSLIISQITGENGFKS